MHRGLVLTGVTFTIAVIVLVTMNYIILSDRSKEDALIQNMRIDKVHNRYTDTLRALDAAVTDSEPIPGGCDTILNTIINDPKLDTDGVQVSAKAPASSCSISFIVETDDGSVHKEGLYS